MDCAWTNRDDTDFGFDSAEDGSQTDRRSRLYEAKACEMRNMAGLAHDPAARREFIALARGYELLAGRLHPDAEESDP